LSRIFLSHSSANNAEAVALRDWLRREGFDDVFLDIDPEGGIAAGERWERALNEAAQRCEAVLFLVSRAWLDSGWCLKEFNLAHRLNKRLFGLLIEDIPTAGLPVNLTSTWQLVRLGAGTDHLMLRVVMPFTGKEAHVTFSAQALSRLKTGLQRAGLDSRFFAWPPENDPERPPYRGLRPLEAEDAGIFFGRDAAIVEALDRLRGLRDAAPPRLLVVLGASGAGKSSFLRAGILPRLKRDDRNFLTLPVVRPGRAAIAGEDGLVRSLEAALQAQGIVHARADIRAAIEGGAGALRPLFSTLVQKASLPPHPDEPTPKPPVLVLPIDQGEELFLAEGAAEAEQLLTLGRDLLSADEPGVVVVCTVRSDSYEQLQSAKVLDGITQQTLSLPPIPKGSYQRVIEGPVARLRDTRRALTIEPALTQALLADIDAGGGRDALPLLAFTLERLYLEYGGRGRLTLADYQALGGIRGSIEAAVERALAAADADPRIPRDRAARLTLLRRGFIPWLAGIDPETGSPRRRVARLSEIPAEARPLIQQLVEQRLLATDVAQDTGEATIEPAHEALLRQWGLLQGWLEEDFGALTTLEGVKRAARDWAANDKDAAWLTHAGSRLEDAERLGAREEFVRHLALTERDYLAACRDRDNAERRAEEERRAQREQERVQRERLQRRVFYITAVALVVMSVVGAFAMFQWRTAEQHRVATEEARVDAEAQRLNAQQRAEEAVKQRNKALLNESRRLFDIVLRGSDATAAALLSLEGLPGPQAEEQRPYLAALESNLYQSVDQLREVLVLSDPVRSPDRRRIAVANSDGTASVYDVETGKQLLMLRGHRDKINRVSFSRDNKQMATASADGTARIWDAETGAEVVTLTGHTGSVDYVGFENDNRSVITFSADGSVRRWSLPDGKSLAVFTVGASARRYDNNYRARLLATASTRNIVQLWNIDTGQELARPDSEDEAAVAKRSIGATFLMFDEDGRYLLISRLGEQNEAILWDVRAGREKARFPATGFANYFVDGKRIVELFPKDFLDDNAHTRLVDAETGKVFLDALGLIGTEFKRDRLVTWGGRDKKVARLWNTTTVQPIADLVGHGEDLTSVKFIGPGERLVTVAKDGARIWAAETGQLIQTLSIPKFDGSSDVKFSSGDRLMIVVGEGGGQVWNLEKGEKVADFDARPDPAQTADKVERLGSPELSADGKRVAASVGRSRVAKIWDVETGQPVADIEHSETILGMKLSGDGRKLFVYGDHKTAVWDLETREEFGPLEGRFSNEFSPAGNALIVESDGSSKLGGSKPTRIWRVDTASGILEQQALRGRAKFGAFTRTGGPTILIATSAEAASLGALGLDPAADDKVVHLIDLGTGRILRSLAHGADVNRVIVSADGGRIFIVSEGGKVQVWSTDSGERRAEMELEGYDDSPFGAQGIAVSADGARLAVASYHEKELKVDIWAVDALRKTGATAFKLDDVADDGDFTDLKIRFTPDDQRLFAVLSSFSDNARIYAFDAVSVERKVAIASLGERGKVVVSPSGRRILLLPSTLTQPADRSGPQLWNGETGELIATLNAPKSLESGWFSPDESRIATTSFDGTHLWDATTTGSQIRSFSTAGIVTAAGFSANGEVLAVMTSGGETTLLDVESGRAVRTLRSSQKDSWSSVSELSFSPDGRRLAAGMGDGISVWDIGAGEEIAVTAKAKDGISGVEFKLGGRYLATKALDGMQEVFHRLFATTGDLVAFARSRMPRCLTQVERQENFLDPEPPAWCIEMAKWPYHTPEWKQWLTDRKAGRQVEMPAEK
jgi:WD40 repeat protein